MTDTPETLTLDIDGWEGPMDLLLALARSQKVDLKQISILALVDQYLRFVEEAQAALELAADYLVMAAWLAYLKSALLLPRDPEVEPDPEYLALRLQLRLERLDAMLEVGAQADKDALASAGLSGAGQELMNIWGEMDRGRMKQDEAFEEADKAVRKRQADRSV